MAADTDDTDVLGDIDRWFLAFEAGLFAEAWDMQRAHIDADRAVPYLDASEE